MNPSHQTTRRNFVQQAGGAAALGAVALGTATLGAAAGLSPLSASAAEQPRKAAKSNIRIGARIGPEWLESKNDNDLRFLAQIGVEAVDVELIMVKGYQEHGVFTKEALRELMARFETVGLRIERANALGPMSLNAHLGRPEGQKEIDHLKRIGELLVEAQIPVYGIQCCQASLHLDGARVGWTRKQGRGGYDYPAFDLAAAQSAAARPKYPVSADQLWKGLLNIYRQVVPIVTGSKTHVAMHGNDPPLYEYCGSPQIICRFADFDRLFSEVPSANSGMTFCVGTRYESGEDVLAGIRHFGQANKIFHVHFRNVRGTVTRGSYAEVFPDDGDLKMLDVLRALDEVGYDGLIDYDHEIGISGDDPLNKQYIAFAVGHMRGLLEGLR